MDATLASVVIEKVVCLEDRALVERRGKITLAPGRHRIRVEGVSPLVVDKSLRVEAAGAQVTDARVVRMWKERQPGDITLDATELRKKVRELELLQQEASNRMHHLSVRMKALEEGETLALSRIGAEAGAGTGEAQRWRQELGRLRAAWDETQQAIHVAREAAADASQALEAARMALAQTEAPVSDFTAALEVVVEASAQGSVELTASYLVPSALWRPAYRATLRATPEGDRVVIEADAVIWQRTGEAWQDVAIEVSTARPTLGTEPPVLEDDWLHLRDKSDREKRVVDVSVREEEIQTVGEPGVSKRSELPGVDDGGETRVMKVDGRSRIPSDGEPHRVHLFRFEAPARSELLAVPELSPLVARVARFDNASSNVLLAGPVELVRESGYVGRTQLRFAAQGERVRLAFGTEDALRTTRRVDTQTDESRITGRRTSSNTVKVFVSNAGGTPVRLAIEERIPKSEVAEVEVKLDPRKVTPPAASVSEDGIIRFEVDLGANQQRTLEYHWELSASGKVAGV